MSEPSSRGPKLAAVITAFNCARTIERTVAAIDSAAVREVIVVDDGSTDDTVALARALPERFPWLARPGALTVHARPRNGGYGACQKDCYRIALEHGADIVVMVHGDLQYDPARIGAVVEPIVAGSADAALGTRIRAWEDARSGGMPLRRYAANRLFTRLQNAASGLSLSEWHSGMRAYTRRALESVPFSGFADSFFFDTQMLFALVEGGFRIGEAPVPVRYADDSSSMPLPRVLSYGFLTLGRTALHAHRRRKRGRVERMHRGMTLIELMVVISIIGLLSSIIMAGLGAARIKAHDASIKANLSTVVSQAGLDYLGNNNSYGTVAWTANTTSLPTATGETGKTAVFNDPTVVAAMRSALTSAGSISYGANGTSWIVVAPLQTGGWWCVGSYDQPSAQWTYLSPGTTYGYGSPAYRCPYPAYTYNP